MRLTLREKGACAAALSAAQRARDLGAISGAPREHGGEGVVLEEHVPRVQLREDGPERPEVDLLAVAEPEHHLLSWAGGWVEWL